MGEYKKMYEISLHKDYNIDAKKQIKQFNSMENYIVEQYKDDIFWNPMLEECYNDYLNGQNKLYEGLITSYPIEDVYNFFKRKNYNVSIETDRNDSKSIAIFCGDLEYVLNKMKKYGYYCAQKRFDIIRQKYLLNFLPLYTYDCTQEVYEKGMCLYHLTNDRYIDKILSKGLIPRSQNKIEYDHPDRIYFGTRKIANRKFISHMFNTMRDKDKIKKLYQLKIDLSKCEDKRFFWDNLTQNGVFTYENIPPQCISIVEVIDVKDL